MYRQTFGRPTLMNRLSHIRSNYGRVWRGLSGPKASDGRILVFLFPVSLVKLAYLLVCLGKSQRASGSEKRCPSEI